jgi:hypothetical protein
LKTFVKMTMVIVLIAIFALFSLVIATRNLRSLLGREKFANHKIATNLMKVESKVFQIIDHHSEQINAKVIRNINFTAIKEHCLLRFQAVNLWIRTRFDTLVTYINML